MAALLKFTLDANTPSISLSLQLSSQGGLLLSQVVSLSIDNSENNYPILVIHGILNEVVQVAAQATVIIPTFSNRGPYTITVSTPTGAAPSTALPIEVVCLNYPRQPGTFSATAQSTIAATGQNTSSLLSGAFSATAAGIVVSTAPGNYVLDSMDLAIEGVVPSAPANTTFEYIFSCGGVNIAIGFGMGSNPAGQWVAGALINIPIQRTWPQGLLLPRGGALTLTLAGISQLSQVIFRLNVSGLNTP